MAKQACRQCKRLITGDKCVVCGSTKLSKIWKGRVIILNPEKSEIAKKINIKEPGEYAIRI